MSSPLVRRIDTITKPLSRRRFIAAGGLLLAFAGQRHAYGDETLVGENNPHPFTTLGGLVRVDPGGLITLIVPNIEMGQGIFTTEAMMIAEELEVDLDAVRVVTALPQEVTDVAPEILQSLSTGGSRSVRKAWVPLRQAGACARLMLVAAAAKQWGVNPDTLIAQNSAVRDKAGTRHTPYGALAHAAARQRIPAHIALKSPSEWKLIGHTALRVDIPSKVNGTAVFGIDVRIPGMATAAVIGPPNWGATVHSFDATATKAIPGVLDVLHISTHVAVVATSYWAARKGLAVLKINWMKGSGPVVSSSDIRTILQDSAQSVSEIMALNDLGTDAALERGKHVESTYELPFLAHAPMEPLNATVHVRSNGCDVWVGTQVPTRARKAVSKVTGLPEDKIAIHNHMIGGSFGRRLSTDFIEQAVQFASHISRPVKFIWSREEDLRQDLFRPAYFDRIKASLGKDGLPRAWSHQITGQSVADRFTPGGLPDGKLDTDAVAGAVEIPYAIPHRRVSWVRAHTPAPVGWWRGVGPAHNVYVVESFMDELAATAKIDPIEYRLRLLGDNPRSVNVLKRAALESGWNAPLPENHGRGVALHNAFGSYCAIVTEVCILPEYAVKIRKVTAVVDCGVAINKNGITAQIEGGILFGFSAALHGKITIKNNAIEQSNFHDFGLMRMNESPEISTFIIDSHEDTGGIGEVGTTAAFASLGNALFSATGERHRSYPFQPSTKT
ncbi:xanthine dehydrogenase family protein molybdopterin-binding subunit [Gluconobacter roseus]|uniref:Aldehyde dehydrogenase n=1 Tax=Gluconobacter roseus NBRC 3990 TaxID=1307950 RepID=A0A4Y3M504_9PROT|nr:molybdopterin cofactor-binding domain-containing protein [Gluconobacter roseus]GBR47702.1 aldehyde dehydrogenase large subunit [Gluconobacter roseus NBRC 3990]GEB02428.1 aldehyde dehydrogenase [Gluconobacter roseus NBRC 3990]GLP94422.1 aldehyde dehydrogenase [Gluconobacter roseus NBRC 3990]